MCTNGLRPKTKSCVFQAQYTVPNFFTPDHTFLLKIFKETGFGGQTPTFQLVLHLFCRSGFSNSYFKNLFLSISSADFYHADCIRQIWYLSPMRAAKVQASLRIRADSPETPLLAHTSSESRGTFRQKARSLAPLNGWACAVKICHDRMLEDTNSLDGAHTLL